MMSSAQIKVVICNKHDIVVSHTDMLQEYGGDTLREGVHLQGHAGLSGRGHGPLGRQS